MFRSRWICLLLLLPLMAAAPPSWAQEWAQKMFETTAHDFGTIARGSKAVFRFPVKNLYEETVHIAGVRSTCGCTSPKVENPTIGTFETAYIVAEFNTIGFRGQHSSTLTVVIDKPFPAEVQLHVYGDVRRDVVFTPGALRFGTVDQGVANTQVVNVLYAGHSDWRIVDVRSARPYYEVQAVETRRSQGRVNYQLTVNLKDDAPAGYINDQLVLVTNDRGGARIPLQVEGRVVPEISVSPRQLVLGEVPAGKTVNKKLVVRAKQEFRILEVMCGDKCFTFDSAEDAKKLHLIDVAFHSDAPTGRVEQTIRIRTDRNDGELTLVAYANVVPAGQN